MSHTISIEDIVSRTPDLPTIPATAVRVMKETQNANSSAASIARILSTDQALSARVLRLANSAYYGLSRRVNELQEGVVVLGMRTVKNLAAVAATYPWMSRSVSGYCLGPEQLWSHSFGTAIGAQLVAQKSRKCAPDVAFTAGLLHDIGKVALSIWIENKIQAIKLYAVRECIPFDAAERKVLGYDHCQVGAYLARSWNLPDEIEHACLFHHRPDASENPSFVTDCVHIGDYMTSMMGFGLGGDGTHYAVSEKAFERLGISEGDLDILTNDFVEEFEKFEHLFTELRAA